MKIEEYIVARVNALLQSTDATIVKRLEGGMSNYTYIVACQGRKYTYRVPGKFAERFVDRVSEWHNIQEVFSHGFSDSLPYVEIRTGEKLADYVEGIILTDSGWEAYSQQVAKTLHQIHSSDMQFAPYDPIARLDSYQRYCREMGFEHPQSYLDLRRKLDDYYLRIEKVDLVPCHCDFQPSNIVVEGDKVHVLDWEFAGLNDPIYDVACYGNVGFAAAAAFLKTYVGREPSPQELQRLYFWRAFQCMQWYNVAIFKHLVGLSKDLNMNFEEISLFFYNGAKELLDGFDTIK